MSAIAGDTLGRDLQMMQLCPRWAMELDSVWDSTLMEKQLAAIQGWRLLASMLLV